MLKLEYASQTKPLPNDIYSVVITRDEWRTVRPFEPQVRVITFSVLDPDPELEPMYSKHPHKLFTERTVEAHFDINNPVEATRKAHKAQLAYLKDAAGGRALIASILRVRTARIIRKDPSEYVVAAVEFLPEYA